MFQIKYLIENGADLMRTDQYKQVPNHFLLRACC
jgi:hypothetical protein